MCFSFNENLRLRQKFQTLTATLTVTLTVTVISTVILTVTLTDLNCVLHCDCDCDLVLTPDKSPSHIIASLKSVCKRKCLRLICLYTQSID